MKVSTAADELLMASIRESIAVKQDILDNSQTLNTVQRAGLAMADALNAGHRLFFFGNGGSAADAQHLAAEFVGRFERKRAALPATALTVNSSALTAISNDYGYDVVFARQIEAFGRAGDVAIGISTSGRSPSVVAGLHVAKAKRMVTVAMTGSRANSLFEYADYCICVPSERTPRIQEAHIMIGHGFCEIVEQALCDRQV